ncbi:MAG: tRNA 2-thiouridine(34) synthase MnmA [Eubacteriales bacterium]|nr:tRNA 2-thiouridine(34) synthase MnmA [Eubacteriales bacterium]
MSDIGSENKGKVLVGMSGGVDSCVAALLLVQQGYTVTGGTMDIGSASSIRDIADAADAASRMGIEHITVDLKESFRENVIEHFMREYEAGRTPNPCVVCNRTIKMGALMDKALELGFDHIATGHYAWIVRDPSTGKSELHKASYLPKDQSYVLYNLSQERLSHLLLPLGALSKDEVRKIASEHSLVDPHRGESQDICFIPDGDYAAYVTDKTGRESVPGDFIDTSGNVIGRHKGITRYTVGQRKGIGIAADQPLYVLAKDAVRNTVTLGPESELFRTDLVVTDVNLIDRNEEVAGKRFQVKIRYSAKPSDAKIAEFSDGSAKIVFDAPQRALAPGQSAVFYDGTRLVGGGVIQ